MEYMETRAWARLVLAIMCTRSMKLACAVLKLKSEE